MGTNLRASLSKTNPYYISKHRYYELKHFCMQYGEWKHERSIIDSLESSSIRHAKKETWKTADLTAKCAVARLYFTERIELVEETAAKATDKMFGDALLMAVTEGLSYEQVNARGLINCGKDIWYASYRRFFWLLDKKRM